jgi:hypothetical protein
MPNAISWIILEAPWNQASANWFETVFEPQQKEICELLSLKVQRICVNEDPAQDVFFQNLMARFAPGHTGWPLNYFCEEKTGRPLMACGALDAQSLPKFLTHLRAAYEQNSEDLMREAEKNMSAVSVIPKLEAKNESLGEYSDLLRAAVNSLVQSLDSKTGSFSRPWSYLFPNAYIGLDLIESEGPSLGLVGITGFLRTPQCDPVEGGFFRAVNFETGEFESEKLLLENMEMLEVLAHFLSGQGSRLDFIRDSFFESFKFILERFVHWDGKKIKILEALTDSPEILSMSNRDLLDGLPTPLRPVAAAFFGVTGQSKLPFVAKSVVELSQEFKLDPVEVRNALLLAREKLSQRRKLKRKVEAPKIEACKRTQALFVYRLLRISEKMKFLPLSVELKGWIRDQVRNWMNLEDLSLEMSLALKAYRRFSLNCGLAPTDFEIKNIDFILGDKNWEPKSLVHTRGWDVFDHLGTSQVGLCFEAADLGLDVKLPPRESLSTFKNIGIRGLGILVNEFKKTRQTPFKQGLSPEIDH